MLVQVLPPFPGFYQLRNHQLTHSKESIHSSPGNHRPRSSPKMDTGNEACVDHVLWHTLPAAVQSSAWKLDPPSVSPAGFAHAAIRSPERALWSSIGSLAAIDMSKFATGRWSSVRPHRAKTRRSLEARGRQLGLAPIPAAAAASAWGGFRLLVSSAASLVGSFIARLPRPTAHEQLALDPSC